MTNREYIQSLNSSELAEYLYKMSYHFEFYGIPTKEQFEEWMDLDYEEKYC